MSKRFWAVVDRWLERTIPGAVMVIVCLVWMIVLALIFGGCGVDMKGLAADGSAGGALGRGPFGREGGRGGGGEAGQGGSVGGQGGIGGIPEGGHGGMGGEGVGGMAGRGVGGWDGKACPVRVAGCVWQAVCGGLTCCVVDGEAYKCL